MVFSLKSTRWSLYPISFHFAVLPAYVWAAIRACFVSVANWDILAIPWLAHQRLRPWGHNTHPQLRGYITPNLKALLERATGSAQSHTFRLCPWWNEPERGSTAEQGLRKSKFDFYSPSEICFVSLRWCTAPAAKWWWWRSTKMMWTRTALYERSAYCRNSPTQTSSGSTFIMSHSMLMKKLLMAHPSHHVEPPVFLQLSEETGFLLL